MKTKYLMLSVLFACTSMIVFAQSKTDTVKVWGNCETCKSKIEKAATAAGATSAEWNEKTKLLVVSYDASQTSNMDIQKKVASAGYDTQDMKATESAYKKLDKCCQYKRPDNSSKDSIGMHGMNDKGMSNMNCMAVMSEAKNMNCSKDNCCKDDMNCKSPSSCSSCSKANDCCKTQFGKGYYYIGSSCTIKNRTEPAVVIISNTNCCKI